MPSSGHRADADGCLPVLLRLRGLRREAEAPHRRLLRVLLVRLRAMPSGSERGQVRELHLSFCVPGTVLDQPPRLNTLNWKTCCEPQGVACSCRMVRTSWNMGPNVRPRLALS